MLDKTNARIIQSEKRAPDPHPRAPVLVIPDLITKRTRNQKENTEGVFQCPLHTIDEALSIPMIDIQR